MALFNYATKEITLKVVYYGPGLCGKTTNLQHLHKTMSTDKKGKLLSLSTDADRTLFFDFMPIHLGKIKGFNIRFQLYTVPGQVRYNATRKLVLKGADAVVFVADSQKAMRDANLDSLQNMKENLIANNLKPEEIPVVLQYNKRDLPSILSVEELDRDINPKGEEIIEAAAVNGTGVLETFQMVTKKLLRYISRKHNIQIDVPDEAQAPAQKASQKKDTVHIAVQDKASSMLDDRPAAATTAQDYSESDFEESILRASMPDESRGNPSQWEAASLETFEESTLEAALPAHESATSDSGIDWEKAFDQPIDTSMGGQTALEKMLEEEEKRKASSTSAVAGDIDAIVSNIREEFIQAKTKQEQLTESLKKIENLMKTLSKLKDK